MVEKRLDPKAELERQKCEQEEQARMDADRGSVEQLFTEYVDDMKRRGKKTWKQVENALLTGKHAAVNDFTSGVKAAEVTPLGVRKVLRRTYERGAKGMAYHLRAYLYGAFKFGVGHENDYTRASQNVSFGLTINPVASIPPDREARSPGQRVLSAEELQAMWNDMPEHGVGKGVHRALQLIVATGGQRVREVVEAGVDEFNLSDRVWVIPALRTKNSREHQVPLTERAIEIVEKQMEKSKSFLFPHALDKTRFMTFPALGRAVRRYCEETNTEHWTPRDIRRTVRTMLAEAGEPDHRLDYHFNHGTSIGVGQKHYDRSARLADKARTMLAWDKVLAKVLDSETGKVVPFRVSWG
jgi:integrase